MLLTRTPIQVQKSKMKLIEIIQYKCLFFFQGSKINTSGFGGEGGRIAAAELLNQAVNSIYLHGVLVLSIHSAIVLISINQFYCFFSLLSPCILNNLNASSKMLLAKYFFLGVREIDVLMY
uniref:Uncharacterized protein n=1 Tax=Micrurus spixii TaxID=129469 RepID=A0A2D4NHR2_9SAUR